MWNMWFFLRVLVPGLAAAIRLFPAKSGPKASGRTFEGQTVLVKTERTKKGVSRLTLGIRFLGPRMRLGRQGRIERLGKLLGLSKEPQTGDRTFDSQVYITGDHPGVDKHFAKESRSRTVALEVLDSGFDEVIADGETLWISTPVHKTATDLRFRTLLSFKETLENLEASEGVSSRPPLELRAKVTTAMVWAIAGYALVVLLEFLVSKPTVFVNPEPLLLQGLQLSGLLFVLFLLAIWFLFKGSSRGPGVFLECLLVLFFSLPIVGVHLIADLNRALDSGPPHEIKARLEDKQDVVRKRQNRRVRVYTFTLSYPDNPLGLPEELEVSGLVYQRSKQGEDLTLKIGPGAFGHLWIKAVDPG